MYKLNLKLNQIENDNQSLTLELDPAIQQLCKEARYRQDNRIPEIDYSVVDAITWSKCAKDEDWLIWRANKAANRLKKCTIEILPGERIVGRLTSGQIIAKDEMDYEVAKKIIEEIPKFPGGDAGHFHPDFDKLFKVGIGGILEEILEKKANTRDDQKRIFYKSCEIVMRSLQDYLIRIAIKCDKMGSNELAEICRNISYNPPETFHEGLQLMFITIEALIRSEEHHLTSPGRIDRTLYSLYKKDISLGRITDKEVLDLISFFFIQYNFLYLSNLAIAVMVGGSDIEGKDTTNELSYLTLAARLATKLVYPTVGIAWHKGTPKELTEFGCKMISTGVGDPAFFNNKVISKGLMANGVTKEDSLYFMNSTCVEIKTVGNSNIWVAYPYFNCPMTILKVMDKSCEEKVPETFQEFEKLVRESIYYDVKNTADVVDMQWKQRAQIGCYPLASCFTKDCLEKGLDIDRGGARYNWVENSFVGLANMADSLYVIKHLIYDTKEMTINQLNDILKSDFKNQEPLRQRIVNCMPHYGNDNDEVDNIVVKWANELQNISESTSAGNHKYVPGFFCWVMHAEFGKVTGATPDGRKAGLAFADGAGAAQGSDKSGPTASILSVTKWDHNRALGGVVNNIRFSKNFFSGQAGLDSLENLIITYLELGGFEIQVNVVDASVLKEAQKHPEKYTDIIVRVAGYSDYFCNLNVTLQDEVILRTENN